MFPKPTKRNKRKPNMKALFKEIWNERPHRCAVCGYPIYEAKAHNFAHIRSKGARPDLKMDKDNIEIWCSTLDRQDKAEGCHELSHTNPSKFRERLK